jgi:hypothetical protein
VEKSQSIIFCFAQPLRLLITKSKTWPIIMAMPNALYCKNTWHLKERTLTSLLTCS